MLATSVTKNWNRGHCTATLVVISIVISLILWSNRDLYPSQLLYSQWHLYSNVTNTFIGNTNKYDSISSPTQAPTQAPTSAPTQRPTQAPTQLEWFDIDNKSTAAIVDFNYSHFKHLDKTAINSYTVDPSQNYRTFEDFNNELFCPLNLDLNHFYLNQKTNKSDNHTNNTQKEIEKPKQIKLRYFKKLLNDVFRLQFPVDCSLNGNNNTNRFYIFDQHCGGGLFAFLHCFAGHMYKALITNRTFIFNTIPTEYWMLKEYCDNKGDECFFLPITNCSLYDIKSNYSLIQDAKNKNEYFFHTPMTRVELNNTIFSKYYREKRVIHESGFRRPAIGCDTVSRLWNGMKCYEFTSMMFNIFLRIQPSLFSIINKMVYKSLQEYILQKQQYDSPFLASNFSDIYIYKPHETISAIIRWGDKCYNNPLKIGRAEQECFTLKEYVNAFKELQILLDYNLTSMIVTSDSREIIQEISDKSLYDPINDLYNMSLIFNKFDIMQAAGVMKDSLNSNPISVMLSMLSTIKLQFGGKYYVHSGTSGWSSGIFALKRLFNCQPLYESHINLLNNNNYWFESISIDYNKNVYVDQNISDILSKLHMDDSYESKKWWNYNAECIEFRSPWKNDRTKFERFVAFSKNINSMKILKYGENDTIDQFKQFGILNRWEQNCKLENTINDKRLLLVNDL